MKTSWLALILALVAFPASAAEFFGRIVGVTDGDTVTVVDTGGVEHKLRLASIDAPERKQAFGARARMALWELAYARTARVSWNKKDRNGRLVGKLYVHDVDIALDMVRQGMAWHYKQYAREQSVTERQLYSDAERRARISKVGLWIEADPIPPWQFRRSR